LGRWLIRPVGHADRRVRPDVVTVEEGVSGENSSCLEIELVFDRDASISGLGSICGLASGRGCSWRRPRTAAKPRAVACAVTADEVIGRKIGALSSSEERESSVSEVVDGTIVEGGIGRRLESLMRECEMRIGIRLIGEIVVEVD
jgi:hypothetical protein